MSDNTEAVLTSPLRGEVAAQRRVRGSKASETAVARARALRRNQTDAEYVLWQMLRNRQIGGKKFVRQYPIEPFFVDFACREVMLVIEVDGGHHAESRSDAARTKHLNARGYSVLRFWNSDVLSNREGCWHAIHSTLQGNPSPDLRFAPATLSPEGRGKEAPRDKGKTP